MSTASAGIPSNQPQRTSHPPGPLAVLAASAIGGLLATRLGKAPFVLAAGAAAYALLMQKKPAHPTSAPENLPPPAPPQEIPAQSQVEQWLSRQIIREEQAPPIDFSSTEATPHEPEDDYHPQSLLLDDTEEDSHFLPPNDSFARLTEPSSQLPATVMPLEQAMDPLPSFTAAAADAAWTLGVEPLPSLDEADLPTAQASSMFFTAPAQQEELGPPPLFSLPVFEGAAFPDEINVAPSFEPAELDPLAHPTPAPDVEVASVPQPAPENAPPPAKETSPEISVQIAAPGEASFDPPLADLTQNPWKPEPDVPLMQSFAPPPFHTPSSVVDAEIILRPRAPMQHSVTPKFKHGSPDLIKKDFAENSDTAPSDAPADTTPRPRAEPYANASWRSLWQGD